MLICSTIPTKKTLFASTVSTDKTLFAGTVVTKKTLFAVTVSPFKCVAELLYFRINRYVQVLMTVVRRVLGRHRLP